MKALKTAPILLFTLAVAACGHVVKNPPAANGALGKELWEQARNSAIKADSLSNKQEKANVAQEGMAIADSCVMKAPENAACYYYRAMNRGVYYSAHVSGYQEGLKSMISDCEKAIALNDKIDHGGAYRILGKIYMEVPETTLTKNGVTRDIDKAIGYFTKAVQIGQQFPENHIYLAEAMLKAGRPLEARECVSNSLDYTQQWKNHQDYAVWKKKNEELSKKLNNKPATKTSAGKE